MNRIHPAIAVVMLTTTAVGIYISYGATKSAAIADNRPVVEGALCNTIMNLRQLMANMDLSARTAFPSEKALQIAAVPPSANELRVVTRIIRSSDQEITLVMPDSYYADYKDLAKKYSSVKLMAVMGSTATCDNF